MERKKVIKYLRVLFYMSCFLLSLLPMLFINKGTLSGRENRQLAEFPSLWENGKFNTNFYNLYESYLKDHFPARLNLIKFYYHFQYALQNRIENKEAFMGDEGWMFSFYRTRNNNIGTQRWIYNKVRERITIFIQYVQTKPIDVYFFLVPDRTQLYQQYWDKHYANRQHIRMGEEIEKSFSSYDGVYVFYPWDKLKALSEKKEVFLKHDIHLYGKAGLQPLVYDFVEILQNKYFPNTFEYPKIVYGQEADANAHYADLLFLDMRRKMTSYRPVSGEYISKEDNVYDGMNKTTINNKAVSNKSILVAGNCYAESIFAQLRELFYRAALYRQNDDKRISSSTKLSLDDIDVIIIAVAEDNMDDMKFLDTLRTML